MSFGHTVIWRRNAGKEENMQINYYKEYSPSLGRDMEFKTRSGSTRLNSVTNLNLVCRLLLGAHV